MKWSVMLWRISKIAWNSWLRCVILPYFGSVLSLRSENYLKTLHWYQTPWKLIYLFVWMCFFLIRSWPLEHLHYAITMCKCLEALWNWGEVRCFYCVELWERVTSMLLFNNFLFFFVKVLLLKWLIAQRQWLMSMVPSMIFLACLKQRYVIINSSFAIWLFHSALF